MLGHVQLPNGRVAGVEVEMNPVFEFERITFHCGYAGDRCLQRLVLQPAVVADFVEKGLGVRTLDPDEIAGRDAVIARQRDARVTVMRIFGEMIGAGHAALTDLEDGPFFPMSEVGHNMCRIAASPRDSDVVAINGYGAVEIELSRGEFYRGAVRRVVDDRLKVRCTRSGGDMNDRTIPCRRLVAVRIGLALRAVVR